MRLLTVLVVLLAVGCSEQREVQLDRIKYCVPTENLLREPSHIDSVADQLDVSAGILALKFSTTNDLDLLAPMEDEVTAVLFVRSPIGNESKLVVDYGSPILAPHASSLDVGSGIRLFDKERARKWSLVPKDGLQLPENGNEGRATWIANCRSSGLSTLEQDSMLHPTSSAMCETILLYDGYAIKLTASEREILTNYDAVKKGIEGKLRSWRCR